MKYLTTLLLVGSLAVSVIASEPLSVLIVDGQNNHDWKTTTPILVSILKDSGRFEVDVATSPDANGKMDEFRPEFSKYDVVVSNYNGQPWSEETQAAFVDYVKGGGGFVSVHAANNSFPKWSAYNRMIGLGGWGGRNEDSGPYVYYESDTKLVRDTSEGHGGGHGPQHEFSIVAREKHPILKGLPREWMHTKDELYATLRGPATQMRVLATAYADKGKGGTGRHEPMLMTVRFDAGRVFHTTLGHADYSMQCVGFATTLQRGTEWAATGKVTIPVPEDFPTADKSLSWHPK